MLIEQDAHPVSFPSGDPCATAARLTSDLPADQALGLRLIALARAAAAIHLNQGFATTARPPCETGSAIGLRQTQAAGLLAAAEAQR